MPSLSGFSTGHQYGSSSRQLFEAKGWPMDDLVLMEGFSLNKRGYAVHWLRPRSKTPVAEGWSTAPVADPATLRQTFRPGYNLGVRCGPYSSPTSGIGLVVVDTDIKVAAYASEALAALTKLLQSLDGPSVASGRRNGSRHDWRGCPVDRLPPKASVVVCKAKETWIPPGKDRPEPVWHIEVLSTGKQVVVPPSIHPMSGNPYEWIAPIGPLPLLPESVHTAVDNVLSAPVRFSPYNGSRQSAGLQASVGGRPGDDFNRRADWHAILLPHSWVPVYRRDDMVYWRRPGKSEGHSATTNFANSGLLHVFTSSAPPFEADTSYAPFTAYTLLEHGGDFKAAAQALQQEGYGIQPKHGMRTISVSPAMLTLRAITASEVLAWRK